MTTLTEITDKQQWEAFPPLQEDGLFLQSWPQKMLDESLGDQVWMMEYRGSSTIRSLVTKVTAKRGTFLYLPYGPLVEGEKNRDDLHKFFEGLKQLAQKEKAAFIRMSPFWPEDDQHRELAKSLGFQKAPLHMLAETLWLLDLKDKSEEELMKGMEKKHRNLIRRAAKDGVEIRKSTDPQAVERFWALYSQTFKRHNFVPYPKKLILGQLEQFSAHNQALMLEAVYEGEVLASAMVMYYGNTAAYHHGASSSDPKYRKIPASYLLQWTAIQEASQRGMKWYNFWGIAPDKNPKHPFYGITHFKCGFGGRRMDLLSCQDLALNGKYLITKSIETLRKWKRGF